MSHFLKDPDAKLPYSIDWLGWLGSDTIVTSTWIVPSGITNEGDSHTDTTTSILLSGGTADADYALTNRITTAAGYIDDRTVTIHVRER